MKKLIALLFVCAGLTAMAVTPHVNTSNVKMNDGKPVKTMFQKGAMQQSMVKGQAKAVNKAPMSKLDGTMQQFFEKRNLTPNDNLLMKKAPRRVTEDVLLNANPLFSAVTYGYDEESNDWVLTYPVLCGGWNIEVENGEEENQYNYYAWFMGIPNIINIDLANNTAEMLAGGIASYHWVDTVVSGRTTTYNDTTEYIYLFNEDFLMGGELANIPGTVYNDGSIYFADGWVFYDICYVEKTVKRSNNTTVTRDTTEGILTEGLLRSTWFMTPNAEHSYTVGGSEYSHDAYMYQDGDSVYAWFLWRAFGFSYRNNEFAVNEDGTAYFPVQPVGFEDMTDWNDQYGSQGYNFYDTFYTFNYDVDADECSEEDVPGTVTPTTLSWGPVLFGDYYEYSDGNVYYPGIAYTNPAVDNKLTWKDTDNYWFVLGVTADPVITTELTDDAVLVNLEVEEGAEWLMVVGEEYAEELPYSLPRLDEDYTVNVQAVAQVYGKDISNVVELEVLVPALEGPSFLRGDVDMDGSVGISDVSALIDYLLSHDDTDISVLAADCDEDGSVGISDVSALIDYLLAHEWE